MADDTQPYGIGSDTWPGLAKLMEECGELIQVLGKIMACEGKDAIYWDGSSLVPHLIEEMGDVRAAMIFFCESNGIQKSRVHARADEKLEKFHYWHATHVKGWVPFGTHAVLEHVPPLEFRGKDEVGDPTEERKAPDWEQTYDDLGGRR